jgi:hypothetical protein
MGVTVGLPFETADRETMTGPEPVAGRHQTGDRASLAPASARPPATSRALPARPVMVTSRFDHGGFEMARRAGQRAVFWRSALHEGGGLPRGLSRRLLRRSADQHRLGSACRTLTVFSTLVPGQAAGYDGTSHGNSEVNKDLMKQSITCRGKPTILPSNECQHGHRMLGQMQLFPRPSIP